MRSQDRIRVLYSFPHRLGAERICYTAWQQVNGLAAAGVAVDVHAASIKRGVPQDVKVHPTLAVGSLRLPYRLVGSMRAFALHDYIVSRRVERLAKQIDVIHTWPLGSLRTLAAAARLGIPTVLERPNAHTRFAYEVVRAECERINVALPAHHEHAYNDEILEIEEEEYRRAFRLLCPSEFVVKTFLDKGLDRSVLSRHIYGYDETVYRPDNRKNKKFTMLFVGVCAVRKGVHFALDAWLRSPAHHDGRFMIAGEFLPDYQKRLATMLADPSVEVLGHRTDVPDLMRQADVLVLPSIEEGFGLVCTEAMGSGCVPLVSDACTDLCRHLDNAMVHSVGDVDTLSSHITSLYRDPHLLETLRNRGLALAPDITWTAAGRVLVNVYREAIRAYKGATSGSRVLREA